VSGESVIRWVQNGADTTKIRGATLERCRFQIGKVSLVWPIEKRFAGGSH
jgi:hypothetical protein